MHYHLLPTLVAAVLVVYQLTFELWLLWLARNILSNYHHWFYWKSNKKNSA